MEKSSFCYYFYPFITLGIYLPKIRLELVIHQISATKKKPTGEYENYIPFSVCSNNLYKKLTVACVKPNISIGNCVTFLFFWSISPFHSNSCMEIRKIEVCIFNNDRYCQWRRLYQFKRIQIKNLLSYFTNQDQIYTRMQIISLRWQLLSLSLKHFAVL